ncbi:MAG TPA: hypothetical protein VH590_14140 [Ktedonobacterales bacterium]
MSEQHLGVNPEHWLHYQRLRRDRALLRRQGYVMLIAAGALLIFTLFWVSTSSSERTVGPGFYLLFIGLSLLLICNGLVMLRRSRQPIHDDEVARRRQDERQQLFQFAQGHISWRYWLAVFIQVLIGLLFLYLGIWAAWALAAHPNTVDLLDMLLSFAFVLFGWYSLSGAVRRARTLRRLARLSSQELAARLSLGEATEGE